MNQTNAHLFKTRTAGRYAGFTESRAKWLESLEGHYNMKTLSDTPNTYNFTATYNTNDKPEKVGQAIIGYMLGSYEQPVIDITYTGLGLKVEYASDEDLTVIFERISNAHDFEPDYDYEDNGESLHGDLDSYTAIVGSFPDMTTAQAFVNGLDAELNAGNHFIYEAKTDSTVLYVSPQDSITNKTLDKLATAYIKFEAHDSSDFRADYIGQRVAQLKQIDKEVLIKDMALYELTLLNYADSILDHTNGYNDSKLNAYNTIELLGDDVTDLVKSLDNGTSYKGVKEYVLLTK